MACRCTIFLPSTATARINCLLPTSVRKDLEKAGEQLITLRVSLARG